MKKLALCLMMLSLGLFSVGCTKSEDAGGGAAPSTPAAGAPGDAAAPAGDAAAPAGDDAAAAPAGEEN